MISNDHSIIDLQLKAYNQRNLEAFLKHYADDIEIVKVQPDGKEFIASRGKAELEAIYRKFFAESPTLQAHVVDRHFEQGKITDIEIVKGLRGSSDSIKFEVTYIIANNLIQFVRIAHCR